MRESLGVHACVIVCVRVRLCVCARVRQCVSALASACACVRHCVRVRVRVRVTSLGSVPTASDAMCRATRYLRH